MLTKEGNFTSDELYNNSKLRNISIVDIFMYVYSVSTSLEIDSYLSVILEYLENKVASRGC